MLRTSIRRTAAIVLAGLLVGALACDFSPTDQYGAGVPLAVISQPQDGALFAVGDTVTFEGAGSDDEDGQLTGDALVWTSSLQGELGIGTGFTRSDLEAGRHVVTLQVTDSDGKQASAEVSISVNTN